MQQNRLARSNVGILRLKLLYIPCMNLLILDIYLKVTAIHRYKMIILFVHNIVNIINTIRHKYSILHFTIYENHYLQSNTHIFPCLYIHVCVYNDHTNTNLFRF